jgi:hypothetical protein
MGKMRNEHNIFVGKPGGKRPLLTPRHKWKMILKMNLREMGLEDVIGFIRLRIGTGRGLL